MKIDVVTAWEILDSRGNPTIRVSVQLDSGVTGVASVPSGASTGTHEALELRDNDEKRYGGKGVLHACENVRGVLARAVQGKDPQDQAVIDRVLIETDGTEHKSALGANALLGVSLATARAAAAGRDVPLYEHIRDLSGLKDDAWILPLPQMNVINGGKHADSDLDVQEYMILPVDAPSFRKAVQVGTEVFHALKSLLVKEQKNVAVGDEGGFAPRLESNTAPFSKLVEAVRAAGYLPSRDVAFGIDAAASEFYDANTDRYVLRADGDTLSAIELLDRYAMWQKEFPLVTLEDGLHEDDWEGWTSMTKRFSGTLQIVGDDFFVTNTQRLERGIRSRAATAILVKVNQIGTLTETLKSVALAKEAGFGVVISHRSGETCDTFIADLAVGVNAGQIKTGSLSRSERTEKYNRLMEIEDALGSQAQYAGGAAVTATVP